MKALFKNPSFILIWLAQAASGLGSTFALFIVSWLVFEITGSKVAMGSIWLTFMIPSFFIHIISGPFLDRLDRRDVMIFSELLRALTFLLLIVLMVFQSIDLWHMYVVAALIGIAEPLFRPSSMAYVAEVLPKDRLQKGNSLLDGTVQTMMLIGPALSGLMISMIGSLAVLITLVSVLFISGVLLFLLPRKERKPVLQKESWYSQFKEGLKFYKMYPVLLWIGVMMLFINFASGAYQPMFLPFVLEELNGTALQYGIFTSAFSFGMIFGSLLTALLKEPKDRRRVMLGALMVNGVFLTALGWVDLYGVALFIIFGSGLCAIIFNINNTTLYQQRVPDDMRGRVFAVRIFLAQAGIPFGAGIGGIIAEGLSIPMLFTILGSITVLITVVAWFSPVFHKINDSYEEVPERVIAN